ncbi:hypothetical protein FOA52_007900 [Chlamydomonas sp. UWO 241]|nr:hypothetical protein FOA52_007900 [Chlamydomonas sp. UWO 241]
MGGASEAVLEAGVQRNQGICRAIMDMCSGKLTGKPNERVLVIVGRAHVASLIQLLKAA